MAGKKVKEQGFGRSSESGFEDASSQRGTSDEERASDRNLGKEMEREKEEEKGAEGDKKVEQEGGFHLRLGGRLLRGNDDYVGESDDNLSKHCLENLRKLQNLGCRRGLGEDVISHEERIMWSAHVVTVLEQELGDFVLQEDGFGKPFLVIHFNSYCPDSVSNSKYLVPAEFSIQGFSLKEGRIQRAGACGLIDPEQCPPVMRSEATEASQLLQVPMIGRGLQEVSKDPVNHVICDVNDAYRYIMDVIKEYGTKIKGQLWVFANFNEMPVVDRCLRYLKFHVSDAVTDEHGLRIAPLSLLGFVLKKLCVHVRSDAMDFELEAHVERLLERTEYSYLPELACPWHALKPHHDAISRCSRSITLRSIYYLLSYFRYCANLPKYPPMYGPFDIPEEVVDQALAKKVMHEMTRGDTFKKYRDDSRRKKFDKKKL